MKPALGIGIVAARVDGEVLVEAREVDGLDHEPATPLQPRRRARLVRQEAVETGPHERAEPRFRGIVALEVFALEHAREELLRQVLRLLGRAAPAQADVAVDGLPVTPR